MIHIALTTETGGQQELDLPFRVEDVLQSPLPFFLAYGKAEIAFETPDARLNEELGSCLPESVDGGLRELSLLAYILGRMDDQRLALLGENLPGEPCGCAELIRRAGYYCDWYLDCDGKPNGNVVPLERFRQDPRLEEQLRREFERALEAKRFTGGHLFERVMARARESGDLARFDAICEYALPDDHETGKLCSYEFDFLPVVNFGSSEGVYVDCSLRGKFDESGRGHIHIGTLKTLSTDLDACKVMGELCGVLMYHEYQFVNENLYLFDSTESIERMLSRKLETVQDLAEGQPTQQLC